jgi:hypothetical protein
MELLYNVSQTVSIHHQGVNEINALPYDIFIPQSLPLVVPARAASVYLPLSRYDFLNMKMSLYFKITSLARDFVPSPLEFTEGISG